MFYKWYKCLRMLANAIGNLTKVLRMKREPNTWVSNLQNKYKLRVFLFVLYLPAPVQSLSDFPSNLYSLSTFVLLYRNVNTNTSESLQMSYNHYKCLANNKNGLRFVTDMLRMVTNMLRLLCEYAFLENFTKHIPNTCIRNTSKLSVNAYRSLQMLGDHAAIIVIR